MLFLGVSTLYFATASGITSSNDGSHYALLRTMVENRTFALGRFDDFAEGNDIALTPDGRLFSDRPPGTALVAVPFYLLGDVLPDPPSSLPSRHDAENPHLPAVLLLPVWAGAATVVLLYLMQRQLRLSPAAALTAALFFALSTIQWKYSTVLFSHALSGFLVVSSVYLVLLLADGTLQHWAFYLLLGFASGLAVLVEYSNALLVVILAIYWAIYAWPAAVHRPLQTALPWALGGLVSALFLAYYNTANFGGPLTLSYAYAVNYPWAGSFSETFSFPLLPGLRALLWQGEGGGWCGGPCVNQGLLLLSPVLVPAVPGFIGLYRRRRDWFWLIAGLFLVYLVLFARHHTSHGFTGDGRYLAPFLGLLVLPLGFTLDWLFSAERRPWLRASAVVVVYGLFVLSLWNQFVHIGSSYNYALELNRLSLSDPEDWPMALNSVFRNTGNLPWFWLTTLLLVAATAGLAYLLHRGRTRD